MYIRRKHSASMVTRVVFIAALFGVTAVYNHLDNLWHADQELTESGSNSIDHDAPGILGRKLLAAVARSHGKPEMDIGNHDDAADGISGSSNGTSDGNETITETEKCTSPAYHEFPPDAFTSYQREHGAIVFHVILVVYMFTALAIVCDVYFVASLDKICERLSMSDDVAGATFMAAGSSAPELFTSIIGVFIAKGDVGVGTIVGSAVFNILFVIGICGILVTQVVTLSWFPLIRDSVFYMMSVVVLISSIADTKVTWYESTIMLVLYVFYIVVMKFNPYIQAWCMSKFNFQPSEDTSTILPPPGERKYYGNYDGTIPPGTVLPQGEKTPLPNGKEIFSNEGDVKPTTPPGPGQKMPMAQMGIIPVDEYVIKSTRKISFEDACFRFMKGRRFRPITRFWAAACIIICERRKLLKDPLFMKRMNMKTFSYDSEANSYTKAVRSGADDVEEPELADAWQRIPSLDEGVFSIIKWAVTLPLIVLLYYTVPDCRQKRWDRWFMVTFIMSIVWIAAFSYIMVWMVVLIGFTMGIPDSIMGITFLAAGTSVPDAMASVMVARQGQGDMAISNTIGSNVFDVLIGLALPWWIKTSCVDPGTYVHINSNGMVFSVVLLFLTVVITLGSIHFGGWRLDKKLGVVCLTSYAIFLLFSILIEFNVFGYVNPPMCRE